MSFRPLARRAVTLGAAVVLAGSVAGLTFVAPAFASGPSDGSQVPSSALPGESYTPGAPFASGQTIDVTIPANSDLQPGNKVNILECGDPGGTVANLPTDITGCDGKTVQGDTVLVQSNGSVSYNSYTVFSLPNAASLGETPTDAPACNLTNECVLYVGENQNDFTAPHVFSQPFYVHPESGDSGTPAGDGASQNLAFSSAPAHPYVGFSYTPAVAAGPSGNPVTLGLDASSSGCSLSSGVVSFTSTGTCVIDASEPGNATYAAALANQSVTLTVDTNHFAIETTSLAPATRGQAYGPVSFAATGGPGPYKWKITSGKLPKGLKFKATGVLSGTPKTKHVNAGTIHFTVSATTKKSKANPTKQTVSQAETLVLN